MLATRESAGAGPPLATAGSVTDRYSVGYDADPTIGNSRPDSAPHMYARPEVRAGVAKLAAHGLVLDAWCYHPQLTDVIALVRAVPQATIVMCHGGGVLGYGVYVGKKDVIHAEWRASMAELAICPNVSVKLGGMLNRGAALNFRQRRAPPNSADWARREGRWVRSWDRRRQQSCALMQAKQRVSTS